MTNTTTLTEGFRNLFDPEAKRQYVDQAWDQLQMSYKKAGGIHGSGFLSKEDFIQNIPFWKLKISNGVLLAAAYYKDKQGRKSVAISAARSRAGRLALLEIMTTDSLTGRSWSEISDGPLYFLVKLTSIEEVLAVAIPRDLAAKLLPKDTLTPPPVGDEMVKDFPELKNYLYQREIGGRLHTKVAIGTPGNSLR